MRNALVLLSSLALAAAASAQIFVLNPVAISGYSESTNSGPTMYSLRSPLETYFYHRIGNKPYSSGSTHMDGWRAEFDIPTAPLGTQLVSAVLSTQKLRVSGSTAFRLGFVTGY